MLTSLDSFVASSLNLDQDISTGLEQKHTWSLQVAKTDPATECSSVSSVIITGTIDYLY